MMLSRASGLLPGKSSGAQNSRRQQADLVMDDPTMGYLPVSYL